MAEDRREAPRIWIAQDVEASVSGVKVRILEMSAVGAQIEHDERFSLTASQLSLTWRDTTVTVPVRVARSEITGRRDSRLIYHSGIFFTRTDALAEGVIAGIIREGESSPEEAAPPAGLEPRPARLEEPLDDSWIRRVNFLRQDPEERLPYAQFRLTANGWEKEYVASPAQPEDGFTILRGEKDFAEIQRTFEVADADTRRMLQIAMQAKLTNAGR